MGASMHRRGFLATTAAASAIAFQANPKAEARSPFGKIVDETSFARLEKVGENIWAAVSTPVNSDGTFNSETVCNGGLIAGADRVVAIDGFLEPAGAVWLANAADELLGRSITDVIVTHFHADHSGGLAGYQRGAEGPEIIATERTRQLIYERYAGPLRPVEGTPFSAPALRPVLPTRILTDETKTVQMDLGGRTLTLDPKKGHTPSDLAVHVDDAALIFAGDLIWAGYFHNYIDAIPSYLTRSAKDLLSDPNKTVVTGHGYVAKAAAFRNYVDLLELVEEKARASHAAGKTPKEGASDFEVPDSLGEWILFNPGYYETAFEAWRRELDGEAVF
ncbi:MAG: MBL fold metallo-hydrolase [Pseudomonadota bacterium]